MDHEGAPLREDSSLFRIAFHTVKRDHHGESERILFEVLPDLGERLLVFQFRAVRAFEHLFGVNHKAPGRRLVRQAGNLVLGQLGRIVIAALAEEAAQEEVVLQRFHIFLERGRAKLRLFGGGGHLLIDLLVVDERPHRALALVDLLADRLELAHRSLRGVQHLIGLLHDVGKVQRRLAPERVALFDRSGLLGSERDLDELIAHETFGLDADDRILLEHLARRALHVHDQGHFAARLRGKQDLLHRSLVDAPHANFRAAAQSADVLERRLQAVCV